MSREEEEAKKHRADTIPVSSLPPHNNARGGDGGFFDQSHHYMSGTGGTITGGSKAGGYSVMAKENVALQLRVSNLEAQLSDIRKVNATLYGQRMHCQQHHKR